MNLAPPDPTDLLAPAPAAVRPPSDGNDPDRVQERRDLWIMRGIAYSMFSLAMWLEVANLVSGLALTLGMGYHLWRRRASLNPSWSAWGTALVVFVLALVVPYVLRGWGAPPLHRIDWIARVLGEIVSVIVGAWAVRAEPAAFQATFHVVPPPRLASLDQSLPNEQR